MGALMVTQKLSLTFRRPLPERYCVGLKLISKGKHFVYIASQYTHTFSLTFLIVFSLNHCICNIVMNFIIFMKKLLKKLKQIRRKITHDGEFFSSDRLSETKFPTFYVYIIFIVAFSERFPQ